MLAVIDTNVVFEGLTKQGGAAGLIIDAWQAGLYLPCVSTALAYEYLDVLSRTLSTERWRHLEPVVMAMLKQAQPVDINFRWRPVSQDLSDDHVVDGAMNANAVLVTANVRDFLLAQRVLKLTVMTPVSFLNWLV